MAVAGMRDWLGETVDHWRTVWGLPLLQVHHRVDSTNDLARDLARQGAPHGATILAETQDRGRGRRGREWIAPPGSSLLLSMVLTPRGPDTVTVLPLRLGLAAARALERAAPVHIGLKWPNDLFVDRLKVGGILCEAGHEPGRPPFVVAGIGINVSQADDDWPVELRPLAASIARLTGQPVDRADLTGFLVAGWLAAAAIDSDRLTAAELEDFRRRDLLHGRPITIDGRPAGIGQGIDPDGALRAGEPGSPRRVMAGTVRPRDLVPDQPARPEPEEP